MWVQSNLRKKIIVEVKAISVTLQIHPCLAAQVQMKNKQSWVQPELALPSAYDGKRQERRVGPMCRER